MRTALRGTAVRAVPNRSRIAPDSGKQIAESMSLVAPVGGWDAVSSLANMPPERAITLDNWFPRPDSIEVRRGYAIHSGGMGASSAVESVMVYHGTTSVMSKMFAAAGGQIWDVTTSSATVSNGTSLGNNRWQWVNFTTAGGNFLWICNGADTPRYYNGTVWTNTNITGITPTDIIHVNAHKHRLWFVLRDSTKAAYLPVDSITGVASEFNLGAFFTKGGYLAAMATWTRDGGSGSDDYAVFISSRGQVAVYQGDDPTSAASWSQVGVYDIGPPIGRRCFTKVGGELALINVDGVVPLGLALSADRAQAQRSAMTASINNAMNEAAKAYASNFGWSLTVYSKGTMVLLNVPIAENTTAHQYVMNTLTGAWCRFTGWDANTFQVFNDNLYFGGNDGRVYQADTGASDLYSPIDATGLAAFNYYKSRGVLKNFGFIRAVITTDASLRPAIGMATDYRNNAVIGTPSISSSVAAVYDTAIWDAAAYSIEGQTVADWQSLSVQGHCGAVKFRVLSGGPIMSVWDVDLWGQAVWSGGSNNEKIIRLNAFDVIYTKGGFM